MKQTILYFAALFLLGIYACSTGPKGEYEKLLKEGYITSGYATDKTYDTINGELKLRTIRYEYLLDFVPYSGILSIEQIKVQSDEARRQWSNARSIERGQPFVVLYDPENKSKSIMMLDMKTSEEAPLQHYWGIIVDTYRK